MKRASGLEFGSAALDYERGRPDWPVEALDAVPVPRDAEVLDLAAGTGKLTRLLARRYARVVVVEPDEGMRRMIEGVETHPGTAEQIPLPDDSVDAVFVAEAFHWFDGVAAVAEIARVLRPRGVLVMMWNPGWELDPPVPEAVFDLLAEVVERTGEPGGPAYASGEWREAFEGSPFESLQDLHFQRDLERDADATVSLWLSVSSVASLREVERAELREKLRALITGTRRFGVTTDVTWTRLAG